jgi:hypothetical protein
MGKCSEDRAIGHMFEGKGCQGEDDQDEDVLGFFKDAVLMVSAFLSSEHLEILLLIEKLMMGGGWQWQGRLPE